MFKKYKYRYLIEINLHRVYNVLHATTAVEWLGVPKILLKLFVTHAIALSPMILLARQGHLFLTLTSTQNKNLTFFEKHFP